MFDGLHSFVSLIFCTSIYKNNVLYKPKNYYLKLGENNILVLGFKGKSDLSWLEWTTNIVLKYIIILKP